MKKYLLLLGLLLFVGCSHQALIVSQKFTLERIKNSEYDFSLVKTEKEKSELLQNLTIMHYSLHKVRELIEGSYLNKDILNQLEYDKLYNGLEQLTKYYSQGMKLFSKALLVADDALYFAQLNLKRERNPRTIVRAYSNISMVYREAKQYTKALKYVNVSIGRAKRTLEKNSVTLANSYYQKSMISFLMKNYKNSINYLHKSIRIVETLEKNERVNLMVFYSQLYKSYKANHENYKAKLSLNKISEIIQFKVSRTYTREEKVVIAAEIDRVNKVTLKMQQNIEQFGLGNYKKIDYLNAYHRMYKYSRFFRKDGKFSKALKLGKSSLFFAKILSNNKESIFKIESYNNLSLIYLDREDYSNALDYVKKAIRASTEILDNKAPLLANSYRTEALIYRSMSQYPQAIKSIKNALVITNTEEDKKFLLTLEKNTPKQEEITFSWAKLKILKSRLFQTEKEYGEYHYKTANIYSEIAKLHLSASQIDKAITYANESHRINKKVFGEKSFKTVDSALLLSNIYLVKHNKEKAYLFAKESVESILELRKSLFLELTPNAKLEIKKFKIDYFMLLAYLYLEGMSNEIENKKIDKVSKEVFNIWLRYKNEISNQESYLVALKAKNKDYKVKLKIDNLIKTKKEYSELFLKKVSNPELFLEDEENRMVKLKEQKDELEAYLSSKISEYKESLTLENVNSFTISQKLNKDELYIDFAYIKDNYDYGNYFSFILNHEDTVLFDIVNPRDNLFDILITPVVEFAFNLVVDSFELLLGLSSSSSKEEDDSYVPLNILVHGLRKDILEKNLTKIDKNFNKKNAKKIYRVLFPKNSNLNYRESIVSNAKKLIISPDGILNLLPFEVLVDRDNYLIEDKKIIYVTSGKDFLKAHQQKSSWSKSNDIVVLSYLDYDNSESLTKRKNNSIGLRKSLVNGGNAIERLRDTKNEAETIRNIFSQKNVRTYSEKSGTKEVLNSLNSPKILHLSTHSFYGEDDKSDVDSLLKSGMALSGYNNYISKLDTRGIMTALEFSNLNLYQTELVLFSSCQSGRGDIHSSEGVYGLNKGAKLAGAKRIISTLWSVPSKESLELTNRFYKHLKENHMKGYADALRETKKEMIEKAYHPFFWAGFVENGID